MPTDAPRFFVDPPLAAGTVSLPAPVAHHARTVLRLRTGDPLRLFDGTGGEWHGQLLDGSAARLDRFDPADREPPVRLVLLQALVATEKLDWIVEKAVELGVAELHLAPAARSSVKLPEDRLERRLAHWRQVIVAACTQCGRNRVPLLHWHPTLQRAWAGHTLHRRHLPPTMQALADGSTPTRRALLAPEGGLALADWLASPSPPSPSPDPAALPSPDDVAGLPARPGVAIAVGPEGGWSDDERSAAAAAGWQAVTLGPRVLRTETAGLAALAVLGTRCGDL